MMKCELFSGTDALKARQKCREMALEMGFSMADQTRIALSVTELAHNILQYAGAGILEFEPVNRVPSSRTAKGLEIRAIDSGPGIVNVNLAMMFGYSTSGGLGMGLPSVKSLMDEVEVKSNGGKGTVIIARKWIYEPPHAE
jgi:serine/threonine-protein kinase RsbT